MKTRAKLIECLDSRLIEDLQLYQTALSTFGIVANAIAPSQLHAISQSRSSVARMLFDHLSPGADKTKAPSDHARDSEAICRTVFMSQPHYRIWLGYPVLEQSDADQSLIDTCMASLADAEGMTAFRDIAVLTMFLSPHKLPLLTPRQVSTMTRFELGFYLDILLNRPVLLTEQDEKDYGEFAPALIDWICDLLVDPLVVPLQKSLLDLVQKINLGEYYVAEIDAPALLVKRKKMIDLIREMDPKLRKIPAFHPPARSRDPKRKIRVGFLARTLKKGPDSESLYALFRDFDTDRFEIFAYTIDHFDRVVKADKSFDDAFDKVLSGRRLLRYVQGTQHIVENLRRDELDIFILANSTHFGVGTADLLISHRVAPVQISSNTVNPLPTSVGAFDHFLTSGCPDPADEIAYSDIMEPPIFLNPTSICYPFGLGKETRTVLNRATIGLRDDDVMFYNGSSVDRLRAPCLRAYMRAVAQVPNGKLVMAPFNSGWSGNLHSNIFWERLRRVATEEGFDLSNVVITNELTLAEARNLVQICDVYLTTWPHGGATTVTLALDKAKPVVTTKRVSSRSIDQFLVGSVGLEELVAKDEEDFVRIAADLGRSPEKRAQISRRLENYEGKMPFFNVDDYSTQFQQLLLDVWDKR
ncbi:glycosyl transferase family 41 [Primorskyibacter sedentarius]|uniref:Glycosyl transferase family 41 n=2 Tax=Primorskyibacter sedentarius TaxID=745311 RepID=A0A4R3JII1_9RHOB|nr:hypothetical protein [Primorskyibacter sedentarius]TCS65315.1 glycosyl transferase family 41 [Primorskyibacter sedentarius]